LAQRPKFTADHSASFFTPIDFSKNANSLHPAEGQAMSSEESTDFTKHIYQIVAYGRPNSGKTCMLAALAMARDAHPDGYATVWVHDETTIPKPSGERNSWDQQDPAVARFLGRERLPAAIRELENGRLPPANAIDVPLRFLFDFTTPDGCIRRVEMIDYSGELVNPEITDGDFARQLIKHMETADGILVLAEATVTCEQAARVLHDLHKLREALSLVSDKRRKSRSDPFPVGLVYDKWDRWSRMEKFSRVEAQTELSEFLSQIPSPPHVALRNVLQAVAGEQTYFHEFVASAFGKSKRTVQNSIHGSREVEIPVCVAPLPAYGLEDPFVEVCRAADELELTRLKRATSRLSPWKLWQLSGRLGKRLASDAKRFARRFPRHLTQNKSGLELAVFATQRFRQQLAVAVCASVLVLMIVIQASFVAYDELMFAEHGPAISKPFHENDFDNVEATLPQWQRAEEFLGRFQTPIWYRWASQWRNSRKWAAEQRLAVSRRIGPALILIGIHDNLRDQLKGMKARKNELYTAIDAENALKKLDALQVPGFFPELTHQKTEVAEVLVRRYEELKKIEQITKLTNELTDCYATGNLNVAAKMLFNFSGECPQVDDLRRNFREEAPDRIQNVVTRLCDPQDKSAGNWTGATDYLNRLEANAAFLDLMGAEFRSKLSRAKDWVVKHREMTIYRDWYDDKTDMTKANLARQSGYREVVDRHEDYLKARDLKRDWRIRIDRLHFVDDGARSKTNAKLLTYCDDTPAEIVASFTGQGDNEDAIGRGEMTISGHSVDSRFTIRTTVMPTNWTFPSPGATGSVETSISALSAKQKKLSCSTQGEALQCEVFISVDPDSLPRLGHIPQPASPSELTLR
jgi:hypothetical protein